MPNHTVNPAMRTTSLDRQPPMATDAPPSTHAAKATTMLGNRSRTQGTPTVLLMSRFFTVFVATAAEGQTKKQNKKSLSNASEHIMCLRFSLRAGGSLHQPRTPPFSLLSPTSPSCFPVPAPFFPPRDGAESPLPALPSRLEGRGRKFASSNWEPCLQRPTARGRSRNN